MMQKPLDRNLLIRCASVLGSSYLGIGAGSAMASCPLNGLYEPSFLINDFGPLYVLIILFFCCVDSTLSQCFLVFNLIISYVWIGQTKWPTWTVIGIMIPFAILGRMEVDRLRSEFHKIRPSIISSISNNSPIAPIKWRSNPRPGAAITRTAYTKHPQEKFKSCAFGTCGMEFELKPVTAWIFAPYTHTR